MDPSQAKSMLELAAQSLHPAVVTAASDDVQIAARLIPRLMGLFGEGLIRRIISSLDPDDVLGILEPLIRSWITTPAVADIVVAIVRQIIGGIQAEPAQ